MSNIKTQLEEFRERDSGWALSKIINIVIQMIKYHPMTASSYIKLPQWIENKHAVINAKNGGKDCFAWAIMTGLFPAKKNCLEFPISIKDIPKFEKLNKISINVFVTEKRKILPHILRKNCLHYFSSKDKLIQHRVDCILLNDCAVVHPAKNNNILQFKNYYKNCKCHSLSVPAKAFQQHKPYSIGYYVSCNYNTNLSRFKMQRSIDCAKWLTNELQKIAVEISEASFCHICEKPFSVNDIKVRDHDHITGLFRGAAHNSCNINYKLKLDIPVIFHNLSNHDAHFLIHDITNSFNGNVKVIPLEKLANYLDQNNFTCLKSEFQDVSLNAFNLLTRKGIFPYDYVKDLNVLNEPKLPFQNDYTHALKVWNTFNIQNIGEYFDLYLKTDVLMLADIFENFRKSCINNYRLDPVPYFILPSYTWDVMLFYTDIKLQLVTDIDILTFIERGIRGGLSQCSNRYAKVIPFGHFEWVENCENFNVNDYADDSDTGYIIEVDLSYPEKVHDLQRDLPMCPENKKPPKSKISKLLATLNNKHRYVIYIDLNTKLRTERNSDFEKNLYKLMNNAVFSKTIENVHNGVRSLVSKPNFYRISIFDEDLVAIQMKKLNIIIDKPIFIGMCLLDLSKVCLYSFHYDLILPKFKLDVKLLKIDYFDTSDYPINNKYNIPLVKEKVIGLMKDEYNGNLMSEFVGLRSKMYAYRINGVNKDKKCIKGIKSYVVKNIEFDDYIYSLKNFNTLMCKQNVIRLNLHNVITICEEKIALSP
ncbi:uncharacterized protein [Prorops nasuta]|uniref:uncharacterized protein n=1 Tax=Prorops nasuta TaxID=863751 RepID=UPI0034CF75C0